MHRAIEQVLRRVRDAKSESDFNYFFSLLLAGEALFKVITIGIISAVSDDKDRNRYRLEHSIVRADGLGEWGRAIDDVVVGRASQYLRIEAQSDQAEITRLCTGNDWQHNAVSLLKKALDELDIESEDVPAKTDLKRWFRLFVILRNKTRAHGATNPSKAAGAAQYLEDSINLICNNMSLLDRDWVYLHRNFSGKYRVSLISGNSSPFEFLKNETHHKFPDGIYIYFGEPIKVPSVLCAGPELRDFFFANGGFGQNRFEMLSYYTDDKCDGNAVDYLIPPGTLPSSETEGHGDLLVKGNCLSNAPDLSDDYVSRPKLEAELAKLLLDDRRPIVTLVGKGGIGKTSITLKVIQDLYNKTRFASIVWLSARDVDLQLSGPKPVKPLVVSPDEMGRLYSSLVLSEGDINKKGFNGRSFFERQMEKNDFGPCLYIFDNFETTSNPVEVFNWIDTFIRLPNKALITTRLRDFKGDYPVEIGGMEFQEAKNLIEKTAVSLGINGLLDEKYTDDIIRTSEGHPYVIKILLGEFSITKKQSNISKIVAGNDELLIALFERTYASLMPCAQRALLTLSAWNSSIPRIALEAVLMKSTSERQEVEKGVESLIQYSLAELHVAPKDQQIFIRLPLVASSFGKKKLNISPLKTAIKNDVELLQMFGPSTSDDIHLGLEKRIEKFIKNIAARIDFGQSFEDYRSILDMICRSFTPGWILLAQWHLDAGGSENIDLAKEELTRFLEQQPSDKMAAEAWHMLGQIYARTGDKLAEIHAFIERSQLSSVTFCDISNTANRLNSLLRDHELNVDQDEKKILALRLLSVLENRRNEAGANDFSRMAWLALHTDQDEKAKEFTLSGLKVDSNNAHCINLGDRLGCSLLES